MRSRVAHSALSVAFRLGFVAASIVSNLACDHFRRDSPFECPECIRPIALALRSAATVGALACLLPLTELRGIGSPFVSREVCKLVRTLSAAVRDADVVWLFVLAIPEAGNTQHAGRIPDSLIGIVFLGHRAYELLRFVFPDAFYLPQDLMLPR